MGFLIVMGCISLVLLALICKKGRLTDLGKRYLGRLRPAFESKTTIDPTTGLTSLRDYQSASAMFLAMGVLGTTALDGTEHAYFHDMFKKVGGGVSGGGGGGCGGGGCGGG